MQNADHELPANAVIRGAFLNSGSRDIGPSGHGVRARGRPEADELSRQRLEEKRRRRRQSVEGRNN